MFGSVGPLRDRARALLDQHWRAEGYTAPNDAVYPWQWLWDSCFHALVWARLGEPDRAVTELGRALDAADPSGFVPHMVYGDPGPHAGFWGRPATSSITQPPIYGHALAELSRSGVVLPRTLVDAAAAGLRHLLVGRPRHSSGLVALVHPWESGCDDSPRWDDTCPDGWTAQRWKAHKGDLVSSLVLGEGGAPVANDRFDVASIGFNALTVFCARELATVVEDAEVSAAASDVARLLAARWDADRGTWVDAGEAEAGSGRIRTLDATLALLVDTGEDRVDAVVPQLLDHGAFGSPWGPAGVHRAEPSFDPRAYWRGPVWPQLGYLTWVSLSRLGLRAEARRVADGVVAGVERSGFAEYWDPDTGEGLGAIPQSWATLAVVMER